MPGRQVIMERQLQKLRNEIKRRDHTISQYHAAQMKLQAWLDLMHKPMGEIVDQAARMHVDTGDRLDVIRLVKSICEFRREFMANRPLPTEH